MQAGFERRLRERWGEAPDEYEVIVEIALMMGWQVTQRWFLAARAARDHRTVGLIELHARCCRVAQEVLALLYAGFAHQVVFDWLDEAFARAETGSELRLAEGA